MRLARGILATAVICTLALPAVGASADGPGGGDGGHDGHHTHHTLPGGFEHLVVIYEENHSFDNLYGDWGRVGGHKVEGRSTATPATTVQRDQHGQAYDCLLQDDVNLTSPDPLPTTCRDPHEVNATPATTASDGFESHFTNGPFSIDDLIGPEDHTCPAPTVRAPVVGVKKDSQGALAGGCTRDLVHRFYQEQYQIHDGRQDRYVTGSDAVGLTMGTYDTSRLPVYRYLHSAGAPHYVVADRFFQAAFGGSFLNHQWLISARTPSDPAGATAAIRHSVLDANGMPTTYPLYTPELTSEAAGPVVDGALTQECATGTDDYAAACGNFAVNTVQPASRPTSGGATIPLIDDHDFPNIGDRLSGAGISWNWYAGRWDDVNEDPSSAPLFQYHHQPFNYFANYAEGGPGRSHLRDEEAFVAAADSGTLPTVSFVKPYGEENEHPGYASEPDGSDHLVDLLRHVTEGPQGDDTLVLVTYDEFGGQWDHVAPPSLANGARPGTADAWGPGTRIPALLVSRALRHSSVDHTTYDTTSILATIERSFGLQPLSTRDAAVEDLSHAVAKGGGRVRH
jgi:phospholipase C